jgi:hypothetical protein
LNPTPSYSEEAFLGHEWNLRTYEFIDFYIFDGVLARGAESDAFGRACYWFFNARSSRLIVCRPAPFESAKKTRV